MAQAIPVRRKYTAGEVRRFAKRAKDAAQARRLLAIAAVLFDRTADRSRSDPMKTLRILVVEDDFWIGTLLAEMLEKNGLGLK